MDRRLLDQPEADGSPGRRKLNGIGQDVEQHLIQTKLICNDILVLHILCIDQQILLLCRDISLDNGSEVMDDIRKMDIRFLDRHLSAFDPAHIQHVIDQG